MVWETKGIHRHRREAFITLKDHKDNFINQPKCRLINSTKSQIGKISSQILKNINKTLRTKLNLLQWQNTKDALTWFKNIKQKKNKKFLQLDIVEFYPSITEELLDRVNDGAPDSKSASSHRTLFQLIFS